MDRKDFLKGVFGAVIGGGAVATKKETAKPGLVEWDMVGMWIRAGEMSHEQILNSLKYFTRSPEYTKTHAEEVV